MSEELNSKRIVGSSEGWQLTTRFFLLTQFLYRRFQVILFGIRIRLQSGEYHTALNPGKDYRFQHNEQCIFIAQNPTDLDDINALTETHLDNFLQHLHKTQEHEYEGIGPDYHAKNFQKAILALSPKSRSGQSTRRVRTKRGGSGMPYSRKSGRYQLYSAMPTITNEDEDDEIDVEPEVSFISGTEDSGVDQDPTSPKFPASPTSPRSPRSFVPPITDVSQPRTPLPTRSTEASITSTAFPFSSGKQRAYLESTFTGDELTQARVDYPIAPFPGAQVPLCILVDSSKAGERKVVDMVISSWSDILNQRREQATALEYERTHPSETAETPAPGSVSFEGSGVLDTPFLMEASDQRRGRILPVDKESSWKTTNAAEGTPSGTDAGHILICSPNYDIFRLICTLRSAHLKQLQDVVVLCSRQPNVHEFRVLKCFPRLYFLIVRIL